MRNQTKAGQRNGRNHSSFQLSREEREKRENQRIMMLNPKQPEIFLLERAADVIKNGGTVVFPTETVYGLGANGLDPEAVKKIYEAKGRPADNPLILHIAKPEHLDKLGKNISEKAYELAEAFWPGPLTMIVERDEKVPDATTAGLNTVAIRCPSHPVAYALIALSGYPIAAPSANLSGSPSPTSGKHVVDDLAGRVDLIITADDSSIGVESTVISFAGEEPVILRPGHITKDDIEAVIGPVKLSEGITNGTQPDRPASPGMKYTHYSPSADVVLLEEEDNLEELLKKAIADGNEKSFLLYPGNDAPVSMRGLFSRSLGENEDEYERNLFALLRDLDQEQAEKIYVLLPKLTDRTLAVRDRLMHAAGYTFLRDL